MTFLYPKQHTRTCTHRLTGTWFIAGCLSFWASSGGTCHFLHTVLLIGPLCISNEANVAATKASFQSCGENGTERVRGCARVCADTPIMQSECPPRSPGLKHLSSSRFALHFSHSSRPLFLLWPCSRFYLSVLSPALSFFPSLRQLWDKKLYQVRASSFFFFALIA